jgi:hypothetical protein
MQQINRVTEYFPKIIGTGNCCSGMYLRDYTTGHCQEICKVAWIYRWVLNSLMDPIISLRFQIYSSKWIPHKLLGILISKSQDLWNGMILNRMVVHDGYNFNFNFFNTSKTVDYFLKSIHVDYCGLHKC